ncbi:MAG: D-2-hydroxyacid dehydrogenase [Cytophagales bacterium]|nr:D-2-hydroxyacid dehydrogenase [Cytophagales bacterium]
MLNLKFNIVFLDAGTLFEVPNIALLQQYGTLTCYHHTKPQDTETRCKDADIVITNKVVIGKQVMDSCPKLKLICVAATGVNNIDLEYAKHKNIQVKNAVGYSTQSVAQLTFAAILMLIHSLPYYDEYVKSGHYAQNEFFTHIGKPYYELHGKTLGIIGLGNIGKAVADIANAFGMDVMYHSVSGQNKHQKYVMTDLDSMLSASDIVSIHCPLTDKTKNILHYDNMCRLKNTSIIVNMSRGGVVHEQDLVKIINENRIAGAAVDVFVTEPIAADSPYYELKDKSKILLTPHIAWASVEARERLVNIVAQNIADFINHFQ